LIDFGLLVLEKISKKKKKFCVFLLFRYYLPVKRGYLLLLKTLEFSPSKDDFLPSLVKICPVVLDK
jgi:hypothetical protein